MRVRVRAAFAPAAGPFRVTFALATDACLFRGAAAFRFGVMYPPPSPLSPNDKLSSRPTREKALKLEKPSFAWPVCYSALFGPDFLFTVARLPSRLAILRGIEHVIGFH